MTRREDGYDGVDLVLTPILKTSHRVRQDLRGPFAQESNATPMASDDLLGL